MKKLICILTTLAMLLSLAACGGKTENAATFRAAVLEINDGYYLDRKSTRLVEPVEGSAELKSADQITVPMKNMSPSPEPEVGDILEIEYDGYIAESYPAQINNVYSIRVVE